MIKNVFRSESGFAMLMALVVILVMAMLGAAAVNLALSEYATAKNNEESMQAFFLAEGGLERALAVLRTDPDWSRLGTSWRFLNDTFNGGLAEKKAFPQRAPIGTYSIYVRNTAGTAPPSGPCPGYSASGRGTLDPVNNAWVRVVGRVGRAARTVEVLAHRLTAGDMTMYSAQHTILSGPTPQGVGNIQVHGSLYVRGDLGLKAMTIGIYNDRPLFSNESDPPGYCNQLYVRGVLDMTQSRAVVGTAAQPLWGAHASEIRLKKGVTDPKEVIHTRYLDNEASSVPYPKVQEYVNDVRTPCSPADSLCYSNAFDPGAIDPDTGNLSPVAKFVVCYKDTAGALHATLQQNLELGATLDVAGAKVSYRVFYLPTKGYWKTVGSCEDATKRVNVAQQGNHVLKWEPSTTPSIAPGKLDFDSSARNFPILVNGQLRIGMPVQYSGIGTIVVDSPWAAAWVMDSGSVANGGPCPTNLSCQILATYRASQSFACPAATSMPCRDLAIFIVNGSARLNGSGAADKQEIDAIIVAGQEGTYHTFLSIEKVQIYGIVIANRLDTARNPDFRQVPDVAYFVPFPFSYLLGGSGGPVVYRYWRELY